MPRCCSVSGCKSNYRSQSEAVTTFSLPKSESLKDLWLKKIPTDFSGVKNPVICIKHFQESDIIRTDSCLINGEIKEFPRKIPKLKEGAFPKIFSNLPGYLSDTRIHSKRLADKDEENINTAIKQSLLDHKNYINERKICNLDDVTKYFNQMDEKTKNNMKMLVNDDKVVICSISIKDDMPFIEGAISIRKNLDFKLFNKNVEIPINKLAKHLQKINSVIVLDELINVMKSDDNCLTEQSKLENAITLLESLEENKNLQFIIEQLKLANTVKNNRRYNGFTLLFATTLYLQSSSAYFILYKGKYLCLPHPRNLEKIISNFSLHGSSSIQGSIDYLKTRIDFLKKHELIVNILLDEIYIESSLTFKGDTIFGYSENNKNKIAKTAQVFMITSILSKYKDVVCIIPVINLTAEQLKVMILEIIIKLESIGFEVLSLISDNNAVNRRAFELFTKEHTLLPCIIHPNDPSRQLFFIFDSVHIIKCVRNNWISKKLQDGMKFPDFDGDGILSAQFKHLEVLYQYEKKSLVKYSNLLSNKVIYPTNIQKQNVKLALKIFDEKNIAALKSIAIQNPSLFPGFNDTCIFLEIFVTWWKIVNVKNCYEGERFNDKDRSAIRDMNSPQIKFLERMTTWLKHWKLLIPVSQALSSQTFQALINTNEAFIKIIPYMLEKYSIDYILLGKFQNDELEGRFGSYRQMSGANYYISYLQLLENERKIRFKSMVLLACDNNEINLKTIMPTQEIYNHSVSIDPFKGVLDYEFLFEDVPRSILNILTYITGYIVMKVLRFQNCQVCCVWLQTEKIIEINLPCELIKELDRGKLILPTQSATIAVAAAWFTLQKLIDLYLDSFLSSNYQLSILNKIAIIQLNEYYEVMLEDVSKQCLCNKTLKNHLDDINERACKILINNLVKNENDYFTSKKCLGKKTKKFKSTK